MTAQEVEQQGRQALFLIVVMLGVALFWVLGRVITGLAALAAEERHAALTARHRDNAPEIGRWLRIAGILSLIVFIVGAIGLIGIEATVERQGIVKFFSNRMLNANIASGTATAQAKELGFWTTMGLVLMVSVPFVFLHAVEGWIDARKRSFLYYLQGRRQAEAWEIARNLHEERVAQAKAHAEQVKEFVQAEWTAQRERDAAAYAREQELRNTIVDTGFLPDAEPVTPRADVSSVVRDDSSPSNLDAAPFLPNEAVVKSGPTDEQRVEVALREEQAREAYARLQEARGRRRDALAWHDTRISAYEQERRRERPETDQRSKEQLEDAYADFIGAVKTFDEAYQYDLYRVERLLSGGMWYRMIAWLLRRPVS